MMRSDETTLTIEQAFKLEILADGLSITSDAAEHLHRINVGRSLTPNDYASTSGLIFRLNEREWINAPVASNNPNFVRDDGAITLEIRDGRLVIARADEFVHAEFWRPPSYHGENGSTGRPFNHFVFTHGDRVRLSPLMGCGMVCKFCNIPYEDRYGTKPTDLMIEAVHAALNDPIQPAHHMLLSGGTPKPADFEWLQGVYRTILTEFSEIDVDIMMVPADGLLDVEELADLGVSQLSINIEIVDEVMASDLMRQKLQHGLEHYLQFIESATKAIGERSIRSMLMVGLEPPESTLRGVQLILEAGGVPVLSPFRPSPNTPLSGTTPPSSQLLQEVFVEAEKMAATYGTPLGPDCGPCTHNTLTLCGDADKLSRPLPNLV